MFCGLRNFTCLSISMGRVTFKSNYALPKMKTLKQFPAHVAAYVYCPQNASLSLKRALNSFGQDIFIIYIYSIIEATIQTQTYVFSTYDLNKQAVQISSTMQEFHIASLKGQYVALENKFKLRI